MILAELAWPILERFRLPGGIELSPHGITVALGFVLGAQLMLRRAQRRGVTRRPPGEGIPCGRVAVELVMQALVTRAAIGGVLGARFFYVVTRLDAFPDPASWFRVWEGGLSLLGGIAGAVLACLPYVWKRRLDTLLLFDSMVTGLAFGIFIGRIGDLVIGEHLGGRTDFLLGWRCTRSIGVGPPEPFTGPQAQGCFDAAVHQTALYDFLAGGVIFALLVWLERRPRFDGFFVAVFVAGYGSFRFVSDFAREADLDLLGPLTGSQVSAIVAVLAVGVWLLVARPQRRTPWAWDPPNRSHRTGGDTGCPPAGPDPAPGGPAPPDFPLQREPPRPEPDEAEERAEIADSADTRPG